MGGSRTWQRNRAGHASFAPELVSVLLFDRTTVFFEAVFTGDDDDIVQFGYSKEGKSRGFRSEYTVVINSRKN